MPPRQKRRTDAEAAAALAAESEIRAARARLNAAERKADAAREELADVIAKHLTSRAITPAEAAVPAEYDAKHVGRIARAKGVPLLRPGTVARKTDGPDG
ncbi:hypothetical protein ACIPRL_08175 [Streptomyces sp. NPDC090085]|uniref:hypothetical protein n=1 Tax=Streptomyces sp. NPDC090085 TaxID=3365943 RepID=UPI00381E7CE2